MADGAAWVEVTTAVPVRFGILRDHPMTRQPSGLKTRFAMTVKAGKAYEVPIRAIIHPSGALKVTIDTSANLKLKKAPRFRDSDPKWDQKLARRLKEKPRNSYSRSAGQMKPDLAFLKSDGWRQHSVQKGSFGKRPFALEIAADTDHCYHVVLRFRGKWSKHSRRGAKSQFVTADGRKTPSFDWYFKGAMRNGITCPRVPGPLTMTLHSDYRTAAPWADDVATGAWTADVWAKPSSPFAFGASGLAKLIGRETRGMRKVGTLQRGRLESITPVEIAVKAKRCYVAVLRLGPKAVWSAQTRKRGNVSFDLKVPWVSVSGGPGARGPGAVGDIGCFLAPGPGTLTMSGQRGKPLGQGSFTLDLFEGQIPAAELRERMSDLKRERRTLRDVREDAEGETCQWCARRRAACDDAGKSGCAASFKRCLTRHGYSPRRCGS